MGLSKYALSDFKRINKIGEGTYGVVYKAQNNVTGEIVAMKKIRIENDDEGIPATAIREVSMLRELRHPNIVDLQDVIMEGDDKLYLVFEFLSCDLKKFLDNHRTKGRLEVGLLKSFTYQITQGMCFCHQRRVLHRDLKPQNLLVDVKTNTIKLADFGLARAAGIPTRVYTHEVVTLWYRAPEVLLGTHRYSMGIDVWSIGCIFAEMARRKPLFQGDSEIDQLFHIFRVMMLPTERDWPELAQLKTWQNHTFPKWQKYQLREVMGDYIDDLGMDFLEKTLVLNPANRCSTKDMLRHPYFADLDKTKLPAGDWDGKLVLEEPKPLFAEAAEDSENVAPPVA